MAIQNILKNGDRYKCKRFDEPFKVIRVFEAAQVGVVEGEHSGVRFIVEDNYRDGLTIKKANWGREEKQLYKIQE